jgi:gliding motility-associated-like protein
VTLKVTDAGGCTSNSSQSRYVSVSGPKVSFSPSPGSIVQLNTTVTFYNNSNIFNSYNTTWKWDFGNGITSTDYMPTCTYTVPGEYIVSLIGENPVTGCKDTVKQTITVRNFNSGFSNTASFVGDYGNCPPVLARFTNTSSNYTRIVWDFGDGFTLENQNNPSHIYANPGKYEVTLFVYGYNGLTGTYKDSVFVTRPEASIHANDLDGCIGQSFLLNAPVHTNSASYLWDFGNGQVINSADSFVTHSFNHPGTYTPSLLVKDKNGCQAAITSPDKIVINPAPTITLGPVEPLVCKTAPVQLTATGGAVRYEWSPATGLSADDISSPLAFPPTNTLYTVKAWDAIGCVGENTITVTVATPIDMTAITAANVCKGSSVQLQAKGADSYLWINTTTGLNDLQIPNPVAKPEMNSLYTIVGYDKYKCYSDTVTVTVAVRAVPEVNAGADRETIFGMENVLSVTNSPDVVRWNWTPAEFLSCTSCAAPVSRPYKSMDYIVTVYNEYNCTAKDTVHINAICTGAKIFIPNSFSPNHDGKNEVFGIAGSGISIVRSFRIYNRWGEIVFEKKNFYPNDISGSWNGKNKGVEAETGIYVYFAELECEANESFERKGTVLLIR